MTLPALRMFDIRALAAVVFMLALSIFSTAHSAPLPTDEEQEILVKATLMTFNDANLTGDYSILYKKAAKQFREQIPLQKVVDTFKTFRDKKVNLDSIVGSDLDSVKATIGDGGVLNLKGRFKDDTKKIRFDLDFAYDDGAWRVLGLTVNYKED